MTDLLDRIDIPKPCAVEWDSMVGNDQVRFCHHCNLNVFNLSTMTRDQAMQLVRISKGRLCAQFRRAADGTIKTIDTSHRLHQLSRRVSRIAAGAFSVALTVGASGLAESPVAAQGSKTEQAKPANKIDRAAKDASAELTGVIRAPDGAVVAGAVVSLKDTETGSTIETKSGEDGSYTFPDLVPGRYELSVNSPGFVGYREMGLVLDVNSHVQLPVSLEIQGVVLGGVVAIREPNDLLVRAAGKSDLYAVKALLAAGMPVNKVDDAINATALQEAVTTGHHEVVDALMAAGADVNLKNSRGVTPLMRFSGVGLSRYWLALEPEEDATEAKPKEELTRLVEAISSENVQILKALLDAGAKVNATDDGGETALISMMERDYVPLAEMLKKAEDPQETGIKPDAELIRKAQQDSTDLVKMLLDAGAEVNHKNDQGGSALTLAAANENPDLLKALLNAGAEIDIVDNDGQTALMIAAAAGNVENVRTLLNAGADISKKDKEAMTALALARKANEDEVVAILKQHGAIK